MIRKFFAAKKAIFEITPLCLIGNMQLLLRSCVDVSMTSAKLYSKNSEVFSTETPCLGVPSYVLEFQIFKKTEFSLLNLVCETEVSDYLGFFCRN